MFASMNISTNNYAYIVLLFSKGTTLSYATKKNESNCTKPVNEREQERNSLENTKSKNENAEENSRNVLRIMLIMLIACKAAHAAQTFITFK